MKINSKMKTIGSCIVLSTFLFGCSTSSTDYSPESVIEHVLADANTAHSYYGESVMKINDGSPDIYTKEWRTSDGKMRMEASNDKAEELSITVNNGQEVISYEELSNTVYTFSLDDNYQPPSLKEQAEILLQAVKDTHTIKLVGEEKLLNRDVYHIKAEVKEGNSLYGDIEFWVDMENWFVLKTKSTSGDTVVELEYTKIDYDAEMKDSLFTLDIPEDAKINDLDEMDDVDLFNTVEEAYNKFGKPFLYVQENRELKIEQIEYMSFGNDVPGELTLTYFKNNLPYFTLSIFEIQEENTPFIGGGEKIRGLQGEKMDLDGFRLLNWAEDGLGYSVILDHPDLTFEEANRLLNGMVKIQ
nr:outer membrane lipoprotein carrier protein LolA [Lysinibacillus timonensis]